MSIFDEDARIAVRHAQQQLAYIADWWKHLPETVKPAAVRTALWNLTICWIDNPIQAEIRLKSVADLMGVERQTLFDQIKNRAHFISYQPGDERQAAAYKEMLCQLMLN